MSPTAEQVRHRTKTLFEFQQRQEELRERLSVLTGAIDSMENWCCQRVGGDKNKQSCMVTNYLLDDTEGIVSLHPIVERTLAGGGAVENSYFLMFGENFYQQLLISNDNKSLLPGTPGNDKWFSVKYCSGWEEDYPVVRSLKLTKGLLLTDCGKNGFSRGITDCDYLASVSEAPLSEQVALAEAIVIALVNAAGIKPEDEKSENFRPLLDQLKRLKKEGRI